MRAKPREPRGRRTPKAAKLPEPRRRAGSVSPVQVPKLRWLRRKVRGQVGDLLVAQALGLVGHQRMVTLPAAVLLQGMAEVVRILAADLRIGRVERLVAVRAVAVDAGLAGGLALDAGLEFTGVDAAVGQSGGRAAAIGGRAGSHGRGGGEHGQEHEVLGLDHGAAHLVRLDRKAARSAMSWSEKLLAWASMVGCCRVPRLYSLRALVRYSCDWPPIFGTR